LPLFDVVRDLSRVTLPLTFYERPDLDHYPHLQQAWTVARNLAELFGCTGRDGAGGVGGESEGYAGDVDAGSVAGLVRRR
jgi:hypothetical protein